MEKYMEILTKTLCYEEKDAKIIEEFIKEKYGSNIDIYNLYMDNGCRWSDEELAENYNCGYEDEEIILTKNIFEHMRTFETSIDIIRLPSELIFTWGY